MFQKNLSEKAENGISLKIELFNVQNKFRANFNQYGKHLWLFWAIATLDAQTGFTSNYNP